jgi:nucleoside-diphosphate-sugar epimerase
MKRVVVLGAGGFIGGHLVAKLKLKGYYVLAIDLKYPEFEPSQADSFVLADLRDIKVVKDIFSESYDEVYQLAADMGGAGYIFTGDHDADIMHNSAQINMNVAETLKKSKSKIFYSSSACIYPEENQMDSQNPNCVESSAFPANPDSEYGWEKLFSERLYLSYARNYGLDIRIARFHNVFGPLGTYKGGKEKAPAAIARKVAEANDGDKIEVWGSGSQTRSFLYIDECLEGVERLMSSNFKEPINLGSAEIISINDLTKMVIAISGKTLSIKNVEGPIGVNGRCSDNRLIASTLNWQPNYPLKKGMENLYSWVKSEI